MLCQNDSLDIGQREFDFVIASNVLHELPDIETSCARIYGMLKPGGIFFVTEPAMHVGQPVFEDEMSILVKIGFQEVERPKLRGGRSMVFKK